MRLHAVIMAPEHVRRDALASFEEALPQPEGPPPRRLLDRLLGRQVPPRATPLVVEPAAEPFVRLAKFGQLTAGDAERLAESLLRPASRWSAPVLHVAGYTVTSDREGLGVVARLGGDIDGLRSVFRSLNEASMRRRYLLDRRTFRADFALGTLRATAADVSGLAELDYEGPDWQVSHISLIRPGYDGAKPVEIAQLPLQQ